MTTVVRIAIFSLHIFIAPQLEAQNLVCDWIHSFGGVQPDWGMDATSDSQGDFIIAGKFSGEVDIDPSENEYILSSTESSDAYLAKYSPNQDLIWAFSIGGTSDENILMVETTQNDNILVCGYFTGTCDFDPSGNEYVLEAIGYGDAFVAIYSTYGELILAKAVGGSANTDKAWACSSDSSGNIYFGGYFIESADLDPSDSEFIVTVPNGTTPDMFLIKLSPEGDFIWGGTAAGSGLEYPYGLAFDDEQNLIVSGLIEGSIDFDLSDSEQIFDSPSGATDMNCYIAKYSSNGALLDARIFGGQGADVARTMLPTSSGYLLGGHYSGTGDFDPGGNTSSFETFGDKDAFLIQLDLDFNVIWSYNFGNEGDDTVNDLALDEWGNIIACGSFEISIDFDPSDAEFVLTVPETVEGVYTDAFVLVLSADGQFREAGNFGGWKSDFGLGVAVSDNKMLLLGNFEYEATSGACSATVNSAGEPYSDDVFALCFNSEYLNVGKESEQQFKIYPNPSNDELNIRCTTRILSIEIFDITGRIVYNEKQNAIGATVNIKSLSTGSYFLSATTDSGKIAPLRFLKE
jgi:hypothetical protein